MDIQKFIKYVLYAIAAGLGLLIVNIWHHDYPQQFHAKSQASANSSALTSVPLPKGGAAPASASKLPVMHSAKAFGADVQIESKKIIHITTDVLDLAVNPVGGSIVSAKLLDYKTRVNGKEAVRILHGGSNLSLAQAGVAKANGQVLDAIVFHASSTSYKMTKGQNKLEVNLIGQTPEGIKVTKKLTFTRGSYAVPVSIQLNNITAHPWQGGFFHRIIQHNSAAGNSLLQRHSYAGAAISTHATPYQKLSFKKLAENNLSQTVQGGWLAMQQPYFVVSWIPNSKAVSQFFSKVQGGDEHGKGGTFTLGAVSQQVTLTPHQKAINVTMLYLGPEIAEQLKMASPTLTYTVNYGHLAPIAMLIFWVMKHIFAIIGNWGWTIVLVTLFIKFVFFPLSDRSYKSMARMREAQPRIQAMQKRYGDDKQALNSAMMKFYKEEKLNPVGGCLPMLIQIPVFFALYSVLIESVQLRQAPFILWITDLSVRDPYFVLPILMGATMFIQQRLSPAPPDPTQAKVMMVMPIAMTAMFLFFPSGLVLYWLTNNLLSVTHQWFVLHNFDAKQDAYNRREKAKNKGK